VGEGTEGGGADLAQERAPGEVLRKPAAQRQCIHEEPDQRLGLRPRPARHGEADQQVLGTGRAEEQRLEGGHQHHERRGSDTGERQAFGSRGEPLRQEHRDDRATGAADRRAWPVGGQRQELRRGGKLLAPPGELLGEHFTRQVLALPGGEVGVLDRQLGERRGPAGQERVVESAKLAHQHAHGPAVGGDVVRVEDRRVLLGSEPQQQEPQERPRREVERAPGLLGREARQLRLARGFGQAGEVDHRHRDRIRRSDPRQRVAVRSREGCTQDLVPADHLGEARGEHRD
jgi:hypothetical protein